MARGKGGSGSSSSLSSCEYCNEPLLLEGYNWEVSHLRVYWSLKGTDSLNRAAEQMRYSHSNVLLSSSSWSVWGSWRNLNGLVKTEQGTQFEAWDIRLPQFL
jgi:hypothetical protein